MDEPKSDEGSPNAKDTPPDSPNEGDQIGRGPVLTPRQKRPYRRNGPREREDRTNPFAEVHVDTNGLPEVSLNGVMDDFDAQLTSLVSQIEADEVELKKCNRVLDDVYKVYNDCFPSKMTPMIFGSFKTGLSFKNSDIDIFLCCEDNPVDHGFVKRRGRKIMRSQKFRDSFIIPAARVPIVRTVHVETGKELDISTTSGQAVCNSEMIKFILSGDSRIRPLIMIILYWAKKNDVCGQAKFTSYSFTLMILFYLQNLKPPLVPPFSTFLFREQECLWPFSFYTDVKILNNSNSSSISQLLIGFFKFYALKPLENIMICTLTGKEIPVDAVLYGAKIPREFPFLQEYYEDMREKAEHFRKGPINVQDPMEQCYNVTRNLSRKQVNFFHGACKYFINNYEGLKTNKWIPKMLSDKPLRRAKEKMNKSNFKIRFPPLTESSDGRALFENALMKALSIMVIHGTKEQTEKCSKKSKDDQVKNSSILFSLSCSDMAHTRQFISCLNELLARQISYEDYLVFVPEVVHDPAFQARLQIKFPNNDSNEIYLNISAPSSVHSWKTKNIVTFLGDIVNYVHQFQLV